MAGTAGIEPAMLESKSSALPLGYVPARIISNEGPTSEHGVGPFSSVLNLASKPTTVRVALDGF